MEQRGKKNRRINETARELFRAAQKQFTEGKHNESIHAFTEFIAMRGESEIALLSRGVAYLRANDPVRAAEDFGRAMLLNRESVRACLYRGMAFMAQNDFNRAVLDFDRAIEIKPDHGAAYFARGAAYAQMGNDYEAARNIKTAITFSETSLQGFADNVGILRTEFDKAITIMADRDRAPSMELTKDELDVVKNWLEERDH